MNETSPRFQLRAFTSVLIGLAFLALALSGVVLFLAPPGRVANWTNWTMLGLRKAEWSGLHVWFATLFLVGAVGHLLFNLRPMLGYLRDRAERRLGWRREWLVAVAVCAVVLAGTLTKLPPFAALLAWNEALKESWDRPASRAPVPHAELLTLAALAEKSGVEVATATNRLQAAGIARTDPEAKVQAIAAAARKSAQEIHALILGPAAETAGGQSGAPGGGVGWKTLRQFCADEGIALTAAQARLAAGGIRAGEDTPLREIAAGAGRKPYELMAVIRGQP